MNKEKVIEIKIDNVIYIVSEENKDENYLKEVIKKLLVEKLKDVQKNELYDKIQMSNSMFYFTGVKMKQKELYKTAIYCRLSLDEWKNMKDQSFII